MKNNFQTISSSVRNIKAVLITCIVLAIVACFGLTISIGAFILFEAIILICCAVMLFTVSKVKWALYFEDNILTITNLANNNQYYFDDLKRSDFIFTQNKSQKERNRGHLKIVASSAVFNDVQSFEEMKAYIDRNFS
ncbi:MAG: hypothetical protein E7596_02515 [Ruminococcaceae bacterium]|nr:hypothetical protein [Oscillospiraceae bacterium]